MNIDKKEILEALKTVTIAGEGLNMVESGAVQNVIAFANEVIVDVTITNPALHIKKRAEEDIIKTYDLGANCFITKPVYLEQFLKVVKSIEDFLLMIVKLPPDVKG